MSNPGTMLHPAPPRVPNAPGKGDERKAAAGNKPQGRNLQAETAAGETPVAGGRNHKGSTEAKSAKFLY